MICSKCVMDTSDTAITFDSYGVCDHCTTYDRDIAPIWNLGKGREKKLEEIVRRIKREGEGKDFD